MHERPSAGIREIQQVTGIIVDVHQRRLYHGTIHIQQGRIERINEGASVDLLALEEWAGEQFILPGFVDAHIHVESSMLIPTEFARLAVTHGTIATVSDPHEIANVLGMEGVRFMLEDAERAEALGGTRISFGAPPCVPATRFETAGAMITPLEVKELLQHERVRYLAEVMNYPGVISGDVDLMEKLRYARELGKPIDGHAPGLSGQGVGFYFSAEIGITTDHECFTLSEAEEKLEMPGVSILIREGSAAKNFEALHSLLRTHPERVMFCSDDKHPHELEEGHVNQVVARAVGLGYDLFDVLRAASVNAVEHYRLPMGLLRVGELADFVEVGDLRKFEVMRTVMGGRVVAEDGKALAKRENVAERVRPNRFVQRELGVADIQVRATGTRAKVQVIAAEDGQLVTGRQTVELAVVAGCICGDSAIDVLKIVVVNRYEALAKPTVAFICGFGMKVGAIASSVAHDSHNVVAVGASDEAIATAITLVMREKGGLAVVHSSGHEVLPLPVGGIMTDGDGYVVAATYRRMDEIARGLCEGKLRAPFMTLSFMALLVIPSLKLSDKGLFDSDTFRFTDVVIE